MRMLWIIGTFIGFFCNAVSAQQPQRICLVGEYHCFLRNYLPQNVVIQSIAGPKIILIENQANHNVLLHGRRLYRDSVQFMEGMGILERTGRMRRLWRMVCNNYYQVIRSNPDALVAFTDTRYTCGADQRPFRYTNKDSATIAIRASYKPIFRAERVPLRDWDYLSKATYLQNWEICAADVVLRLKTSKLSDRQKMLVFHFFQEHLMLWQEGMDSNAPIRDSLFFRQIMMLAQVFPGYPVVALHGARHTQKKGGRLYEFLSDAGMNPETYSILYHHFEEPSVEKEDMITNPELKFTEAMHRKQLSIIDVRACTDCSADYTVYFDNPETILGYLHFFEIE